MRLARCGPKVHVRETWEANFDDMQTGAASLRPENQAQDPHLSPHPAIEQHQGN